ncbi:TetR/AcrR family transcriptional regulator [Allostreptomyces psammosilenae]|uniref:AcrR family transcriptional regulator n=1 Tax=Allostreptomyces psammosilenae TaxID=1892865 RepID=A0A853A982_9ACTN|nr:TetR/AcrR family transcriptional regulator [Allostreptomyces psammosilenae]NYI07078.1 AcrR family transcriptional regulator [Allostreptomyces psammosilenae]
MGTPRNRETPLTVERIADAALALADRGGLEGVTMRAVAAELGVSAMGLYRHVRSRDELLDAMVTRALEELPLDPAPGEPWERRFADLFRGLYRTLAARPVLTRVRLGRPFLTPGAMRLTERALELLRERGLDETAAITAYRAVYLHTLGCAAFVDHADPQGARREARTALAALPPEEFPHLAGSLDTVVNAIAGDAAFEYGLRALVSRVAEEHGHQV